MDHEETRCPSHANIMDGVVVVERLSGSLQYTRAFTKRFEQRHPASERMNLGALFFALQNFASNSFQDDREMNDRDAHVPAITLFETAAERIVLAQSVVHQLLIVLFVRRSMDIGVAKSVIQRIACHYDYDLSQEMRLATVLSQGGELFREACEKALRDEVDSLLQGFAADQGLSGNGNRDKDSPPGFILFHYSPSLNLRRCQGATGDGEAEDSNEDDGGDDRDEGTEDPDNMTTPQATPVANEKESGIVPASAVCRHEGDQPQRLQKLFASTRSVLAQPAAGQRKRHVKKNAVMNLSEPRAFQSLRLFPSPSNDTSEPLVAIFGHPQFTRALVDALQPNLKSITALMLDTQSTLTERTLKDVIWRRFPLPRLSVETSDGKPLAVDLRVWKRDGCILVHTDHGIPARDSIRASVALLFDNVEPLARCGLKISP